MSHTGRLGAANTVVTGLAPTTGAALGGGKGGCKGTSSGKWVRLVPTGHVS